MSSTHEVKSFCGRLGALLGTRLNLEHLDLRAEAGVVVANATIVEHGPAGTWSLDAAAADRDESIAARRVVMAAVLDRDDVFTGALKRFVSARMITGALVTVGGSAPHVVGSIDEPHRMVALLRNVPAESFVALRTASTSYGIGRTARHGCAWQREGPEPFSKDLGDWFRICAAADAAGVATGI